MINTKIARQVISTARIVLVMALVSAVALTSVYFGAAPGGAPDGWQGFAAYADTTTGGAVTGGAVAAPVDIAAAQVVPIKDLIYNGKVKRPSPKVSMNGAKLKKNRDYTVRYKNNKKPGQATVTIKGKSPNYTGSLQITFNIIIQAPEQFKLKTDADSVNALWKKPSGKITGYKVVYAENAKFTKSKKVKTLTSDKAVGYAIDRPYYGRNYYVKVRAYTTVGGKDYYSEYTKVKNRTTKDAGWFSKISDRIGPDTKWIEADLSKQIVYLHKGREIVKTYAVSSGRPGTPTVRGTYRIYKKIKLHDMRGDWDPETQTWGYVTPNVKWASYFTAGYAFHGSYWNPEVNKPVDEKRTPRSHGCVNMREKDAKYLYNWAPIGTLVNVHK
jgi:lipoprotein-anchoring transpeptidase ErfK/SrfK